MSRRNSVAQNQQMNMMQGVPQLGQQQPQPPQQDLPQQQDIPKTQAQIEQERIEQERYTWLRSRALDLTTQVKKLEVDLALHNQRCATMPEGTHQLIAKQFKDQIDLLRDELHKIFLLIKAMAKKPQQGTVSATGDTNGASASPRPPQNNPQQGPSSSQSSQLLMTPDPSTLFRPVAVTSGRDSGSASPRPAQSIPQQGPSSSQPIQWVWIPDSIIKPYVGRQAGRYPTEADIRKANEYKKLLLAQTILPGIDKMTPQLIPPGQEPSYAVIFQELCGYAYQVYPAFALIICADEDSVVMEVMSATMTALRQKELSEQKGSPHYLIALSDIRRIMKTVKTAAEAIPYGGMHGRSPLDPL